METLVNPLDVSRTSGSSSHRSIDDRQPGDACVGRAGLCPAGRVRAWTSAIRGAKRCPISGQFGQCSSLRDRVSLPPVGVNCGRPAGSCVRARWALCDSRAMSRRFVPRIRDWAGALGEVAHSGPLRRAQVSFGAMWASESAFMVALGVVAFRDGGVVAVGDRHGRAHGCGGAAGAVARDRGRPGAPRAGPDLRRPGPRRDAGRRRGGDGRRRPGGGDVRPRGRRHGRAGAVPAGALGPAARRCAPLLGS